MKRPAEAGLSLIEIVLGAMMLSMVVAAILGAYIGQLTLNEHARYLSFATQDANRVMEEVRQNNINAGGTGCAAGAPTARPDGIYTSWDAWINAAAPAGGGPKSLPAGTNELIVVTCQNAGATAYCDGDQVGAGEWQVGPAVANFDPVRITVSVCWWNRGRVIGECEWDGAMWTFNDQNGNGVIESPAMLTNLVTCRQT